ncbi:ComEA family DNA-binding protein [Actinomadura hibisca]|uniref:ComEA family DNA-binding protein n=1 Tax=Actinomadura hibisca TaxID=68565 RepID=UPI000A000B76|nr:ComEA family DNA-binding protein [Actinomadura hibisca]
MKLHDRLRRPTPFGEGTPLGPPRNAPPAAHLRSSPDPPERVRIPAAEEPGPRVPTTKDLLAGPKSVRIPGIDDLDPGPRSIRTLIVIGVIAALAAVAYLWMARPTPEPAPSVQSAPSASPDPQTPQPLPSPSTNVTVHVFGKVKDPGVISLPTGSRIADAIKAAGGTRPDATTGTLNLARKLQDGEQIPVGVPAPTPPPNQPAADTAPSTTGGTTNVDLNNASAAELDALPGVGPVLAQRIVEYRTQHGGFRSVEQLQEVTGIGARRFAELKPMVRI